MVANLELLRGRDRDRSVRPSSIMRSFQRSKIVEGVTRLLMGVVSGGVFAGAVFGQKGLERTPNIFFLLNLHGEKIGCLDLRKKAESSCCHNSPSPAV